MHSFRSLTMLLMLCLSGSAAFAQDKPPKYP